jgi:hypothetical protein
MKYFFSLIFVFLSLGLYSQEDNEFKTIFGGREMGGYGSFSLGYSMIDTSNAFICNARGGVILGHTLAMGLGGSCFVTEYQYDRFLDKKANLTGGYGGVFMELIVAGKSPVHLSIPCLVGVGAAAYSTWDNEGTYETTKVNYIEDVSSFFVLEPGIELEFNMTKFFRIAGFFNYRYTTDLVFNSSSKNPNGDPLVKSKALNGYTAGLIFKFGKF